MTLYQFCVQVPELQNGNVDLFALGVEVLTTMCASTYFFSISMCIVRISVLLFYARIFDKSRWFKISLWTIGALCWSLCLSQLVYYGDYYIPGIEALKARSVFTQWGSFLGPYLVTIAGVILDVLILLVPLPKLWGVQVSKTKRFNLFVVFLLGYWYVGASSLSRSHVLANTNQKTQRRHQPFDPRSCVVQNLPKRQQGLL